LQEKPSTTIKCVINCNEQKQWQPGRKTKNSLVVAVQSAAKDSKNNQPENKKKKNQSKKITGEVGEQQFTDSIACARKMTINQANIILPTLLPVPK